MTHPPGPSVAVHIYTNIAISMLIDMLLTSHTHTVFTHHKDYIWCMHHASRTNSHAASTYNILVDARHDVVHVRAPRRTCALSGEHDVGSCIKTRIKYSIVPRSAPFWTMNKICWMHGPERTVGACAIWYPRRFWRIFVSNQLKFRQIVVQLSFMDVLSFGFGRKSVVLKGANSSGHLFISGQLLEHNKTSSSNGPATVFCGHLAACILHHCFFLCLLFTISYFVIYMFVHSCRILCVCVCVLCTYAALCATIRLNAGCMFSNGDDDDDEGYAVLLLLLLVMYPHQALYTLDRRKRPFNLNARQVRTSTRAMRFYTLYTTSIPVYIFSWVAIYGGAQCVASSSSSV